MYILNKIRLFILKNIYQIYYMSIFGVDKLAFVVGLGITLLLCGLIMFYVKQKFAIYDRALMDIGQQLKYLVGSIQHGIPSQDSSISAQGAVDQAKRTYSMFGGDSDNRILVSDDENEKESDGSESENDSESDDSDNESVSDNEKDDNSASNNHLHNSFVQNHSVLDDDTLNIKQINLPFDNIKVVNVNDLRLMNEQTIVSTNELSHMDNGAVCSEDKCVNLEEFKLDNNDELLIKIHNDDNLESILKKKIYVDLTKSELQELCKERNLSVKGSKKDLIDRLIE